MQSGQDAPAAMGLCGEKWKTQWWSDRYPPINRWISVMMSEDPPGIECQSEPCAQFSMQHGISDKNRFTSGTVIRPGVH